MNTKKYQYQIVTLPFSMWTGRAKADYLEILNDYGSKGWKFVEFAPGYVKPKGAKGIEMIFEKEI